MPIGCFVAKSVQRMTITRNHDETLGLALADLVVKCGCLIRGGMGAAADTIRNSLVYLSKDHA